MSKWHRVAAAAGAAGLLLMFGGQAFGLLTDLSAHWSAPLVAALEARGIVSGDSSGRFEPEAPLTRAHAAKLLVGAMGTAADASVLATLDSRFTDIPGWHWAKGYVESLSELGLTQGFPDGGYHPGEAVTRAQMAAFLVRAAELSEAARLKRLEPTPFADDAAISDWARGVVNVALSAGLITGYENNTFRPDATMTRAEGGSAVLRLTEYLGTAYHLGGTLLQFDPVSLSGRVRDAAGGERDFTMTSSARFFRGGLAVQPQQVGTFDQVWVWLNGQGQGAFLEARYLDLAGASGKVNDREITITFPSGSTRAIQVQPGALVFLNGKPAPLSQVDGARDVYLVLDQITGQARIVDAVAAQ